MPIAQFDLLIKLVRSLNKAEKRHFRLYVNRLESNQHGKFLKLFDLLDKPKPLNESKLLQKLDLKSTNQFSNLKRHLYAQIVKSLRLMHSSKTSSIKIREYLDYATILYGKGLFHQSLLILEKAKAWAKNAGKSMMYLEILELQKKIESRHITRSRKVKNRVEDLIDDSAQMRKAISTTSEISDFSLIMQGLYIKFGFVRNQRDNLLIESFFQSHQPKFDVDSTSFYSRVLWYQCMVWYHYMRMDFKSSKTNAIQWLETFEQNPSTIGADPDLYMRGLHYYLTCSFYEGDRSAFDSRLLSFKSFLDKHSSSFNTNSKIIEFIYYENACINHMFIHNDFSKADEKIKEILNYLVQYKDNLDKHRAQVFHYKVGMIYLYRGQYNKALDYFNEILSSGTEILRSDIFCYTRLLHLICHYCISNFELVENLISSVKNSFINHNHNNDLIDLHFAFIRKGTRAMNFGLKEEIILLQKKLQIIETSSFGKVSFLYFDFYSWLESLLKNTSIENI